MNYHYCTCVKDMSDRKQRKAWTDGRSPYRRVTVNADDMCNNCGHYTVTTREYYDIKSGALRKHLMGERDDMTTSAIVRRQKRESYHRMKARRA